MFSLLFIKGILRSEPPDSISCICLFRSSNERSILSFCPSGVLILARRISLCFPFFSSKASSDLNHLTPYPVSVYSDLPTNAPYYPFALPEYSYWQEGYRYVFPSFHQRHPPI